MPQHPPTDEQVGLDARLDEEHVGDLALWAPPPHTDARLRAHSTIRALVAAAVRSPRPHVRATVAARPDLSADAYGRLAADPDRHVRGVVAANRSAPAPVLEALRGDDDRTVRIAAGRELARRQLRFDLAGSRR